MTPPLALRWREREPPLAPACAVASGSAARELAVRLLARTDEALAQLQGVGGESLLAIVGASADLPWVDGVIYLGRDSRAPALLMPTQREPDVHPALVESALVARGGGGGPWGVLLDPPRLVNLGLARPLARAALEAWAKGHP